MFAEKGKQATIRASTYSIFSVVVVFTITIIIIMFYFWPAFERHVWFYQQKVH